MQTATIPTAPFSGPHLWHRESFVADPTATAMLPPECIEDIDAALAGLRAGGRTLETLGPTDFPFPRLGPWLRRFVRKPLAEGIGIGMIRGFPAGHCDDEEAGMLFWGMSAHIGVPVSQNASGDRLGHVCDQGKDDEAPDHLAVLFRGFEYDRRGEAAPFRADISERRPIFSVREGQMSCAYVRQPIKTARIKTGVPSTDAELAALDAFDEAASRPENTFSVMLEPGDVRFFSNHVVLHSRTEYQDGPEPGRERHMLRLWLKVDGIRVLDEAFIDPDADTGRSRREGVLPRGMTIRGGRLIPA